MPSVGDLGTLAVTLGAKTADFRRDLAGARGDIEATGGSMRGLINTAGKLGVAAIAAGGAIVAGLVVSGLQAIDAQAKLARQLDGTIDGLRGLQIASEDAGVNGDALEQSMRILNARLGEAQRQAGPTREMFDALGLSAEALSRLDVDQRMAAIADRIRELGLSSSQTADLLRNLGIRSGEMVDFMRQGGEAIRDARREVDDFGLSVSAIDAQKIEAANDAMQRVGRLLEGIRNQFAIGLAPILGEIADRINDLVKSQGGWADVTKTSLDAAIRKTAKLADVIQGLRVAYKAAEVVGIGFAAAVVSAGELAAVGFQKVANFIINNVNDIIEALNKLPGVELQSKVKPIADETLASFRTMAVEIRNQVGIAREELHNMAMEEMPSAKVEAFLAAVEQRANAAAEAVVGARDAFEASTEGGAEGFAVEEDPAQTKLRDQLQGRLDAMRDMAMTELELAAANHAEQQALLDAALEQRLLSEQEYLNISGALNQQHMDTLKKIREDGFTALERFTAMSFANQTKSVIGALVNMTAGVSQHSRAMFEINKAAGIANAIVSTAEGVSKALGAYPPPVSFVMAGLTAAAGLAQINAIRGTSFGGGGGAAPSLAGGTPAPPVTPVASGQAASNGRQTIAVEGLTDDAIFNGKTVRGLLKRLQAALDDGGTLVLD